MPFNTNLPAENSDPWYAPLVAAWAALTAFVNGLETALTGKADTSALTSGLAGKISTSERGANSGVATLDAQGKLLTAQLPALAVTEYLLASANQAAMLAKTGQQGDWTIRTDTSTVWIITGANPTQLASWTEMGYPSAPVTTVNGKAGVVVLTSADVGAASAMDLADFETQALAALDDLSDIVATKASSADVASQLAGKASAADLDNVFGRTVDLENQLNGFTIDVVEELPPEPRPANVIYFVVPA